MKRNKLILFIVLAVVTAVTAVTFAACNDTPSDPDGDKKITGVTFSNVTVYYDGQEHEITVTGTLPQGANVSYENNKGIQEGVYNAKATITCDGYEMLVLQATLTIQADPSDTRKTITGVTFADLTVDYDGQEHEITVSGTLPQGAKVDYVSNKGTNAGTYNAKATVTCDGYKPLVLQAALKINKINYDMSAVTWNYSQAFTYDGTAKSVTVNAASLPDGVTVKTYSGNTGTNAQSYNAKVTFNYDENNYNAPQLANCNWKINKADITANITFSDETAEYDAQPHSIQIVAPNLPSEIVPVYTYNGKNVESVTEVGTYEVVCTLESANYNKRTLTATLVIKSTEEQLFSVVASDGSVYFQNNLDGNKLYKVSGSGVTKVNNDVPDYMIVNGSDVYYYSASLFNKVIKCFNGTTASPFYATKGEYLTTDGTYIYYAVNNLLVNTEQNGIYKLKLDASDDSIQPTRLTADKAAYLTYHNGYIYYANKSDGDRLYRVSVNASEANGTQLRTDKKDEKVAYIIADESNLYFNSTKTTAGVGVAAAICKYNISSGSEVKLTVDAGKYLTKIGGYIYYVNNDKLTSALFGDGIYMVSAAASSDNNLPGIKVLSSENNGYSSLSSDGTNLYYYKLNDKHFYKNSKSGNNEIDLMKNFEPIDDSELTLSSYSKIAQYKGEIYYTNPLDDGALYKYNPKTKAKVKVLASSVCDVTFATHGGKDYMFYSSYLLTNYDTYRMDMASGEIIRVSKGRIENLIFENDAIYGLKVQAGNNIIFQTSWNCVDWDDDANRTVLYEKPNASPDTTALYKVGDTFYFIMNPNVGYRNVDSFTVGDKDKKDLQKALSFVIVDNKIYYYSDQSKALMTCGLDGSNPTALVSSVDITYMYTYGGKIYYSSKSSQNSGLYVYDTAKNKTTKISGKSAHGMTVMDGKLYFLQSQVTYNKDYPAQSSSCDGRLYCYDGSSVTKVA